MLDTSDLKDLIDGFQHDTGFRERDAEYGQNRQLLYQQRNVVLPNTPIHLQYRTPELEDSANKYRDRMLAAHIKINVAARSQASGKLTRARANESFFYRYYHHWRDQQAFDALLFNAAALGIGWTYLGLNRDLLPDLSGDLDEMGTALREFSEHDGSDLFVLEGLQPDTVYWSADMEIVGHKAEMPYHQLRKRYQKAGRDTTTLDAGVSEYASSRPFSDTVILYTVADSEHIYHCVSATKDAKREKMETRSHPNFFGRPPFFFSAGSVTGDPHPFRRYRPLIQGLYQTGPIENVAKTAKLSAGVDTAQQRYQLVKVDMQAPDLEGAQTVYIDDAGILHPPPGYEMKNTGLATGPDLLDMVQLINAEKERYTFPRELARPGEVGATSGYDRSLQKDSVETLLDPPLTHFAAMLSHGVFPAIAQAVKALGVPITVRNITTTHATGEKQSLGESVTLKPEDVEDMDINVEFKATSAFAKIGDIEMGLQQLAADQMTETQFQTQVVGIDDMEAFREERAMDKIRKFVEERAITDVQAVIDALRGTIEEEALASSDLHPLLANSDLNRPDRGPAIPTGPSSAAPLIPTPPGQGTSGLSGS